jgi:hypothetical protein
LRAARPTPARTPCSPSRFSCVGLSVGVRSRAAPWRRSASWSHRRARKEHMAIEGGLMALTGARHANSIN